jgi:hypothetical protein
MAEAKPQGPPPTMTTPCFGALLIVVACFAIFASAKDPKPKCGTSALTLLAHSKPMIWSSIWEPCSCIKIKKVPVKLCQRLKKVWRVHLVVMRLLTVRSCALRMKNNFQKWFEKSFSKMDMS